MNMKILSPRAALWIALSITLTSVGPIEGKAQPILKCSGVLRSYSNHRHFAQLSAEAQRFWIENGRQIQDILNSDFARTPNRRIFEDEINRGHPHYEFLKTLGFELKPEGLQSPPIQLVLERLMGRMDLLNQKLMQMDGDVQIQPEIYLNLIDDSIDRKQNVVLAPLQGFFAPGFRLETKGNILSTAAFTKKASEGRFPIGSIENASPSNITRAIMDLKEHSNKPNIVDFLHDLAHIGAFDRHPEYARSYVRVFRHFQALADKLPQDQRRQYLSQAIGTQGAKSWFRNFLFAESAWIVQSNYRQTLKKWPTLLSLLNEQGPINIKTVNNKFETADRSKLFEELREVSNNWWRLFDPLGGAVNDMVSTHAFNARSQFPIHKALLELEAFLRNFNPSHTHSDYRQLVIVLGILKNSDRLTIARWEYFGRASDLENTEVFRALCDMFPINIIEDLPDWHGLGSFLNQR